MPKRLNRPDTAMVIAGPRAIADLPPIPWKNGGGVTRTVAQEPAQASLDSFVWRISLAEIHASGSFSIFPGIDRSILLWSGEGLVLHSPAWPDQRLSAAAPPFAFSGESDVCSELISGPSQDLNLMVRRGAASAEMYAATTSLHIEQPCDELVVLCVKGSLRLLLNSGSQHILPEDYFLRVSNFNGEAILEPLDQQTRFAYITICS